MLENKTAKELNEQLFYQKKSVYQKKDASDIDKAYDYAKGYAAFLDAAKTEREAVREAIRLAESKGFAPYRFDDKVKKAADITITIAVRVFISLPSARSRLKAAFAFPPRTSTLPVLI